MSRTTIIVASIATSTEVPAITVRYPITVALNLSCSVSLNLSPESLLPLLHYTVPRISFPCVSGSNAGSKLITINGKFWMW